MLLSTDGNDYKNSPKNTACTTHCVVHAAGGEGGIRPAALGQCRRQPGELKNHSLDGFFPATGGPFPSHPSFFYAARKRDRKCDLFFVAEKEGFEIGHRHRPACAPRRSVRPDTISRPLKSRHRRDFSLQAAASNPSVATARNKTVHTGGLISWRRRRDSNPRASHPSLLP